MTVGSGQALATGSGTNQNCASLDSTQGGAPYVVDTSAVQFTITLAVGDVLTITGSGTLSYQFPGFGGTSGTSLPVTLTVGAGSNGVWTILRSATTGNTTFSCSSATSSTTSESDNLDQQQAAFTSMTMLHHAQTMTDAIGEETGGQNGGGQNSITPTGFTFSTRASQGEHAITHLMGYGDEGPDTGAYVDTPWNLWIRGRYSAYDGDNNSFDGYVADLFAGVDYAVSETLTLGLLAGYNDTDFDTLTSGTPGAFSAAGYTFGGYASLALGGDARLSGAASYTRSDYDARSGSTTGSFDADRLTLSAELAGTYQMGVLTIVPAASVLWASEDQDGYTDSAAVVHATRTISALRLSAGPKILFPEQMLDSWNYRFWLAARAEYDDSSSAANTSSGIPDLGTGASARLSAGLNFKAANNASLQVRGDVFGLGSGDYLGVGGSMKYVVPF